MNKLVLIAAFVCLLVVVTAADNSWFNGCLKSHNNYRSKEGKPKLKKSSKAMSHAQKRVKQLVSGCKFDHSGNKGSGFGENLYMGSGSLGKACKTAVKSWYDEKKYYRKSKPGFSAKTGHYTQVVWKSTTGLGCAKGKYKKGCKNGMTVVVCSYTPAGNIRGKFPKNV